MALSVSIPALKDKKVTYPAIGVASGIAVGMLGSYLIKGKVCALCTIVAALAFGGGGYWLATKK